MFELFASGERINYLQFQEIFKYCTKRIKPVLRVFLSPVKELGENCYNSIVAYDKLLFLFLNMEVTVVQLPTLELKKTFTIPEKL